jgi:hypothetical protein
VATQQQDQALLHQRLGQRPRPDTRAGELGQHQPEGVVERLGRAHVLHKRPAQPVEQAEAAAVGGRDRAAGDQQLALARAGVELDQPVRERDAALGGGRLLLPALRRHLELLA